ncbi:hypothetical protein BJV74DRAFT_805405, partial [Russula compacta]
MRIMCNCMWVGQVWGGGVWCAISGVEPENMGSASQPTGFPPFGGIGAASVGGMHACVHSGGPAKRRRRKKQQQNDMDDVWMDLEWMMLDVLHAQICHAGRSVAVLSMFLSGSLLGCSFYCY